jgi:hypothetical protein
MLLNAFAMESFLLSLNNLKNICHHLHEINSSNCSVVFLMDVEYYALPVRSLSYLFISYLILVAFCKIKHFFGPRKNPCETSVCYKGNFSRITYLYHNDLIYNDITFVIRRYYLDFHRPPRQYFHFWCRIHILTYHCLQRPNHYRFLRHPHSIRWILHVISCHQN